MWFIPSTDDIRNPVLDRYEVMARYGIDGETLVAWEYEGLPVRTITYIPGRWAQRIYFLEYCDHWVKQNKFDAVAQEMQDRLSRVTRVSAYVDLHEAAARLGVTAATVRSRVKKGKLNGMNSQNRRLWVREEELPAKAADPAETQRS